MWRVQLSNIIVRLSSRQHPRSKEDAILVNAHLDSTLPSPGAADDLAGVSVMVGEHFCFDFVSPMLTDAE